MLEVSLLYKDSKDRPWLYSRSNKPISSIVVVNYRLGFDNELTATLHRLQVARKIKIFFINSVVLFNIESFKL